MKPKAKRITIPVSKGIDEIRDQLSADTGIKMTYNQVLDYLIHFYLVRTCQPTFHIPPRTEWRKPK
jgi:hypothetical protein